MTELTRMVLDYQQGRVKLQQIFQRTAPLIYNYPLRSRRGGEDECGEFLLYYYHRMLRLLERYRYQDQHSFEAYLFTSMRYQYSTFLVRRHKKTTCSENSEIASHVLWETNSRSTEKPLSGIDISVIKRLHLLGSNNKAYREALKRRIIILALINAAHITEAEIATCAHAAHIKQSELSTMIDTLNIRIQQRSHRSNQLRRCRNKAFVKLFAAQQRQKSSKSSEDYERGRQEADRARLQLDAARVRLSQLRNRPMHTDIAELMHIPRGSVHSTVHLLRQYVHCIDWNKAEDLEMLGINMLEYPHDHFASNQQ